MENFKDTRTCHYKGETYQVRDNGAIYREAKNNAKPRKDDNKWTFGNMDAKTGYLKLGSHRVHIIVATAFLGEKDGKTHVVDHYDENKANNKVSNLRWFTKIEYALFNEVALRKIIFHYKSLKNFMEAPNAPIETDREHFWLQTISQKEATTAGQKLLGWLKNPYEDNFRKTKILLTLLDDEYYSDLICISKAAYPPTAIQIYWDTPTEFPLCPKEVNSENPIDEYFNNLKANEIVTKNIYCTYYVDEFVKLKSNKLIIKAHSYEQIKNYSIIKITYDNNFFVHEGITFFEENGALKEFSILQGLKWDGEDSIDDYC